MAGKRKRRAGAILLLLAAGVITSMYLIKEDQMKSEDTNWDWSRDTIISRENPGHAMTKEDTKIKETENLPAQSLPLTQKAGTVLDTAGFPEKTLENLFYSEHITAEIAERIQNISYRDNPDISLEELRYLRVLHVGFDGQTYIGELIVNQSIEQDILKIMKVLYENQYPIEKMILIDEYDGVDESSMADNNTSAFNYREIAGSSKLSKHSMGMAIDINPRFNPCVRTGNNGERVVEPENGLEYADRSQEFFNKIGMEDLCYQLFSQYGFTWGGNWNSLKDYQHFEK